MKNNMQPYIFDGAKRYKPLYSEDYIKCMPICFEKEFRLENIKADIKEKTSSILLIPRPYEDFISK
jgi:hypothetical protein